MDLGERKLGEDASTIALKLDFSAPSTISVKDMPGASSSLSLFMSHMPIMFF